MSPNKTRLRQVGDGHVSTVFLARRHTVQKGLEAITTRFQGPGHDRRLAGGDAIDR